MDNQVRDTLVIYDPAQEIGPSSKAPDQKLLGATGRRRGNLPPVEAKQNIEQYLNAILPPRQWDRDSRTYIQFASTAVATRNEVNILKDKLDQRLIERQARDSGICPVREELYSQCFDELIRQVTLECVERGLMLSRVRDEIKMTIAAYQTLYLNSVSFGNRMQLKAEEGKTEMERAKAALEHKRKVLDDKKAELIDKREHLIKKYEERRAVDEAKRKEELDLLEKQGMHLSNFVKNLDK